MKRRALELETITLTGLPDEAVPAYEAALQSIARSVGYFREEPGETWRLEAVREKGADPAELATALTIAALVSGHTAEPERAHVEAEGWLARTVEAFPEQEIGGRFLIRPTHMPNRRDYHRTVLRLDAGLAFGSGEHNSTRGCLMAFERVAARKPRRIADIGSGSGILAMAAATTLKRKVLATDIEPWSVRIAGDNAVMNGLRNLLRARLADGWRHRRVAAEGPYDLIFANILARPLCAMAKDLGGALAPGGTAILAGLLGTQARWVMSAHRHAGLVLERRLDVGPWTTLVLRKRA
ncbi:50S ribosomal protein L11 methyltransferase [Rhodovarius crocodyli]|uniref:Ribosomal protein L11 methyltransferase n=1 Tax=Rhodovarius crocodyli TaxID=1979269 RepID=A0A437MLL3_9PROT|nr:50S ribosomal protein L11 methyltransferase [Rhodovarius crocodyli]RVT98560.1 50S ribosomal protein L11 methyltransferase [Rhodovarius crocodyli]